MRLYRLFSLVWLLTLLNACSMYTTPVPPPPPTNHAQQVNRAQISTLTKIGNITAQVFGSPMDLEAALQSKADSIGAHYYLIVAMSSDNIPGRWQGSAIVYQ
jgi:hypothetical protein